MKTKYLFGPVFLVPDFTKSYEEVLVRTGCAEKYYIN